MSSPFSRRTTILVQAVSILLFALVSAVVPQYAFVIFLLYFIVFMVLAMKATARSMKVPPRSELGSPIFKEPNAVQAMLTDKMLQAEMGRQMKLMFLNLSMVFLVFILLPVYSEYIWPFIAERTGLTESSLLDNFVRYLGMYMFFIGVMQGSRYLLMRGQQPVQPVFSARSFAVYRKGVVLDERQFIQFTQDVCFNAEQERKFVELRNSKSKATLTRLYTLEVGRLVEKLREAGLGECQPQA